jgi:hypothetical protein
MVQYSSRRLGRRWHPVRSVHAQSRARASAGFPARLLHAQRRPCLVPGACPAGPDVRFVSPVASIHRGLIRSGGKGGGARPGRRLGSVRSLVVRLLSHLSLSISRSRACVDRWWATLVINWRAPCRAERGFVVVVVVVHRPRGDSSRPRPRRLGLAALARYYRHAHHIIAHGIDALLFSTTDPTVSRSARRHARLCPTDWPA